MPAKRRRQVQLRELFAANVRAERARRGFSQEDLAELAGVHPTYISRVEAGQYNLGIDSIEKFANALGVDPDLLLSAPRGRVR